MDEELPRLHRYLRECASGELEITQTREVEILLAKCLPELTLSSEDAGLKPYKLLNRTEHICWDPPFLTFEIERHGATDLASVYGSVYPWMVDVEKATATMGEPTRRLVRERDKPPNVQPIAQDLVEAIAGHKADPRLVEG